MEAPTEHQIETFTGVYVDTARPQAKTIYLQDIAHGLARTCRFGGQCSDFYSVAEHAVLCAWYADGRGALNEQLACLHHDDAEAYLGDVPRPMKKLLGGAYRVMTDRMDIAVCAALALPFGVNALHGPLVREADNWALLREAEVLLPSRGLGWSNQAANWDVQTVEKGPEAPSSWAFGLKPIAAEALYLRTHRELMERV